MYQQPVHRSKPSLEKKPAPQSEQNMPVSASSPTLQLQRMAGNQAVLQMGITKDRRRKRTATRGIRRLPKRFENFIRPGRRIKYTSGMHGGKQTEQRRLSRIYGFRVTGKTHESEHTIGFEPLNQTSGMTRGVEDEAKVLENTAWAYQEIKGLHSKHIGTGNKTKNIDDSGFNAISYRNTQRKLLESGDVSSAVQINQLGYAFLMGRDKQKKDENKDGTENTSKNENENMDMGVKIYSSPEGKAANDSYDQMITNMDEVTYAQGDKFVDVPVDAKQKAEMYLARRAMITGKFPTVEEENAAREKFGLPLLPEEDDSDKMEIDPPD